MEKYEIIGNLTNDPGVRQLDSGQTCAKFGVAVNHRIKKADGTYEDKAKYINVTTWGNLAQRCTQYLSKGKKVYISGVVDANAWLSNRDETCMKSLEMTAYEVEFLSPADKKQ